MALIKRYLQGTLRRAGLLQRLKVSGIYDLYWRVADRRWIDGRQREVAFYRNLLQGFHEGDLIFDIGANSGQKTDIFLRLGARVAAVEPDEICQGILREKFLRYRFSPKPVTIVGMAVSDRSSVETMWVSGPGSALNTLSVKWVEALKQDHARFHNGVDKCDFVAHREVETATLDQLMDTVGSPFFVKIDVEGYERRVIRGLGRPVPYLSFEVNLPDFRAEGLECVDLLNRLSSNGRFNFSVDFGHGLALDQWVDAQHFQHILGRCSERSVEVFWKSSCLPSRN